MYPHNSWNGFMYNDKNKRFTFTSKSTPQTKCDILTCLTWAIDNKKVVAEIMSKVIGIPFNYKEFELTLSNINSKN